MFPKHETIRDPQLIKQMKKEIDCCEICGSPFNLEAAHIEAKGMGGPDMRENIVIACGPAALGAGCHHRGRISKEVFWRTAARREKITVDM